MDGIPWEENDIIVRSYIYLSLGNGGQRRRLNQHYPDLKIQETTTRDFWTRLQHLFIKDSNETTKPQRKTAKI